MRDRTRLVHPRRGVVLVVLIAGSGYSVITGKPAGFMTAGLGGSAGGGVIRRLGEPDRALIAAGAGSGKM